MRWVALLTLISFSAHAAEDIPLAQNEKAPFTGVLVSTDTYAQTIKDKADLEKLKTKSLTLEELAKFKEAKLQELLDLKTKESEAWRQQAEKNAQRTWWDENKLQVGVLLGIVTTITVTFAVAETIKAAK